VLEAVRQTGCVAGLLGDPILQPENVERNCIAGRGCRAPLARILALFARPDHSIEAMVAFGLGGSGRPFVCASGQTIGDLATLIVWQYKVEGGLVHVGLPGRECCSPLEVDIPLAALTSVAPGS